MGYCRNLLRFYIEEHTVLTVNVTSLSSIPFRGNELLSFSRSNIKRKGDVEFRHSTPNVSKIGRTEKKRQKDSFIAPTVPRGTVKLSYYIKKS